MRALTQGGTIQDFWINPLALDIFMVLKAISKLGA